MRVVDVLLSFRGGHYALLTVLLSGAGVSKDGEPFISSKVERYIDCRRIESIVANEEMRYLSQIDRISPKPAEMNSEMGGNINPQALKCKIVEAFN